MTEFEKTIIEVFRKRAETTFLELAKGPAYTFNRLKELFIEYGRLEELETEAINSGNLKEAEIMRDRMLALFKIGEENETSSNV